MEATKTALMGNRRIRMAGDLLWFATASVAAGLLAALAVAALAMLLVQPAQADSAESAGLPAAEEERIALMRTCNRQASGLRGEERRDFMLFCLSPLNANRESTYALAEPNCDPALGLIDGACLATSPFAGIRPYDPAQPGLLSDEPGLPLLEEPAHPLLLILGGEEELDRLGFECETGVEDGVHPTEHGFPRLLDRERHELTDLLRRVDGSLLDAGAGDELTDEAHVIRLAGAQDVAGDHVAHCLVYADSAREVLRAAAAAVKPLL